MIEHDDAGRLLAEMVKTVRILRTAGRHRGADERLAGTEYGVLQRLRDGGARQGELAHRLEVSAPVMSRALAALEEEGLVERTPDPEDARAVRVEITADGARHLARRDAEVVARFAAALDDWGAEDAERAVRILGRLNDHLGDAIDPRGRGARHDERREKHG